jgi:hypothetical protein
MSIIYSLHGTDLTGAQAAFVRARISLHDDSVRTVAHDSCNTALISLLDDDRDSLIMARDRVEAPTSLDGVLTVSISLANYVSCDSFVTAPISLDNSMAATAVTARISLDIALALVTQ